MYIFDIVINLFDTNISHSISQCAVKNTAPKVTQQHHAELIINHYFICIYEKRKKKNYVFGIEPKKNISTLYLGWKIPKEKKEERSRKL